MDKICFSMAMNNLKNNKRHYRAYLSINAMIVMFVYLFVYIANNEGITKISGGGTIKLLLFLGTFAVGVFAAIFQFYINSFLMKRRKKEYGLYSILGLEKKHISKIMLFENIVLFLLSAAVGIIAGMLSGKGIFRLLLRLMKCSVPFDNAIRPVNILVTCLMFFIVSVIVYIYNVRTIYRTKTIDMLKGAQKANENTKKSSILKTVTGVAMVVFAAFRLNHNVEVFGSIEILFINVIVLLLGTYWLYEGICYFILKALSRIDGVYYKKNSFFPISNMLYRNKQTAAGLASICIILTVISIITSTTVSLYAGSEKQVNDALAYDGLLTLEHIPGDDELITDTAEASAAECGVTLENSVVYHPLTFSGFCNENSEISFKNSGKDDICLVDIITAEDYSRLQGDSITLGKGQAAVISENNVFHDRKDIVLGSETLDVVNYPDSFILIDQQSKTSTINDIYVIVSDEEAQKTLMTALNTASDRQNVIQTYYEFGTSGRDEDRLAFENMLKERIDGSDLTAIYYKTKHMIRNDTYAYNSVYLFLGFFLAILFLCLMLVVMYHKQLQEAVDDSPKYGIMRKIGCSESQCRKIIRNQSCVAYFAPVVLAGAYSAVMYRVICSVLKMFMLGDTDIIVKCILFTFGIVFAIYAAGYLFTNRIYAKTVLGRG